MEDKTGEVIWIHDPSSRQEPAPRSRSLPPAPYEPEISDYRPGETQTGYSAYPKQDSDFDTVFSANIRRDGTWNVSGSQPADFQNMLRSAMGGPSVESTSRQESARRHYGDDFRPGTQEKKSRLSISELGSNFNLHEINKKKAAFRIVAGWMVVDAMFIGAHTVTNAPKLLAQTAAHTSSKVTFGLGDKLAGKIHQDPLAMNFNMKHDAKLLVEGPFLAMGSLTKFAIHKTEGK